MMKKTISIVLPCFNEEFNIPILHRRLINAVKNINQYDFEIIYIDNASTDGTENILRELALADPRVKVILNIRNFGHIRSPYYAILQAKGAAVICIASDLQCPPELIGEFILNWEKGWKLVFAVKKKTESGLIMRLFKNLYYSSLEKMSDSPVVKNSTGFGLYDRTVVEQLRATENPYPYVRGMVCELGYPVKEIDFTEPKRPSGKTKNNFYTLYDMAMLGIITQAIIPIRMSFFIGFVLAFLSFLIGGYYLVQKVIYWDSFNLGLAPLIIGSFLFSGLILIFIGILGEYLMTIHRHIKKMPIVVEKERLNF